MLDEQRNCFPGYTHSSPSPSNLWIPSCCCYYLDLLPVLLVALLGDGVFLAVPGTARSAAAGSADEIVRRVAVGLGVLVLRPSARLLWLQQSLVGPDVLCLCCCAGFCRGGFERFLGGGEVGGSAVVGGGRFVV